MKTIAFDLDGTIYDLYGQRGWLPALEHEDSSIFVKGDSIVDLKELKEVCYKLQNQGWTIGVITWLPKQATPYFKNECTKSKKYWLEKNGLDFFQFITCQSYGTPKQQGLPFRGNWNILVDDNKEIREEWQTSQNYQTIDATGDILAELRNLLK